MKPWIPSLLCALLFLGGCGNAVQEEAEEAPVSPSATPAVEAQAPVQKEGEPTETTEAEGEEASPAPGDDPADAAESPEATPPVEASPAPPAPVPSQAPVASPTPAPAPAPEIAEQVQVRISHESQGDLALVQVKWVQGQTAFEALQAAAADAGLYLQSSGFGPTVYVEGIDRYFEFDEGPLSGWHFLINGHEGNQGAGQVVLQAGDHVHWQYRAQP